MAFRSDLDAVILGTLSDGPMHGYGIVKRVQKSSEGFLKLGEGQLYPALHRLEEMGFVTAEWTQDAGKPFRRLYCLTPLGTKELQQRRSDWKRFAKSINALLKTGNDA